jgi:hypothetical protein
MPENPYIRAARTPAGKVRLRPMVATIRQKRPKPPRPPGKTGKAP